MDTVSVVSGALLFGYRSHSALYISQPACLDHRSQAVSFKEALRPSRRLWLLYCNASDTSRVWDRIHIFYTSSCFDASWISNVSQVSNTIAREREVRRCQELVLELLHFWDCNVQCLNCEKLAGGLTFSTVGTRPKLLYKSYVYSIYLTP